MVNDLKISVENIHSPEQFDTVIRVNIKGVHQTFRQYTHRSGSEFQDLFSFGLSLEYMGKMIQRQAKENKLQGES